MFVFPFKLSLVLDIRQRSYIASDSTGMQPCQLYWQSQRRYTWWFKIELTEIYGKKKTDSQDPSEAH